jgi:NAD(P)-dependent dehydrogenase (short-subunit alcohol dehydrogenase family)
MAMGLPESKKEKRIAVNSVCPRWCRTEMGGSHAPRSVEEGAAGIVWLAADAPQEKSSLFLAGPGSPSLVNVSRPMKRPVPT